MNLSRQSASLFLINFAYLSSIIYVPFVIFNNSVINKFFPFFCLCCLFVLLKKEIKLIYLKKFFVVFLIAVFSILSSGGFISLAYTLVFLSLIAFIFPYYTLLKLYKEDFLYKHLYFIVGVSIVALIFGWIEYLYPSIVDQLFFLRGSIYLHKSQVSSFFSNPNIFGLMMAFTFQIACILHRNIFIVLMFFAIFLSGAFLSESRMSIFIIFLMLFFKIIPLNKTSLKFLVSLTTLSVTFFSFNYYELYGYLDFNLRDEVWDGAIAAFFSNPILGIGLGQFQLDVSTFAISYFNQSANNMFLGLLAEIGIIGFTLFNYFWLKPIISYKKGSHQRLWFNSSIGLMFLINSQYSEYMIIYVSPYVLLILLFIAVAQWTSE